MYICICIYAYVYRCSISEVQEHYRVRFLITNVMVTRPDTISVIAGKLLNTVIPVIPGS